MEKKSYEINNIYQGGYSSLNPEYGNVFSGYRASTKTMGLTTDPRTANILQDVSAKIATGVKQIEVAAVSPQVFESIPNQQLKEVNRLSKLTGVGVSVHGPLIEASGMTKEGYNDLERERAERQMNSALERSHEISPQGNVPVTFHSSVIFPGREIEKTEKGEEVLLIPVINQETGQTTRVKKEIRHYPGMSEKELIQGVEHSAEQQLKIMNKTEWDNALTQLISVKERSDDIISETYPIFTEIVKKLKSGTGVQDLTPTEREVYSRSLNAHGELQDIELHLNSLFNKAYKYGTEDDKKYLARLSDNFGKSVPNNPFDLKGQSRAVQDLMEGLRPSAQFLGAEQFKPIEEFTLDKTATTFANVAFNSYKKFKDNAPLISIENPPAGGGFSRAEDLKKIVETAREKFVEKARKEGLSERKAREQAAKLIGVTWDVGHINMLRKYGYKAEDIIKETEKVAPFVKHVHLSDNFGFEHTELPMGMGNVPLKEMMKRLGKEGFEAKKIIEAASWWEHFKTPPVKESFEALGSPIYPMKAPYWNQVGGLQQGYFSGYGRMLPQLQYEMRGAGFSQLPMELGGERPDAQGGRMSGRPLE
jgi:sugar phosphate isomerase/epimerase